MPDYTIFLMDMPASDEIGHLDASVAYSDGFWGKPQLELVAWDESTANSIAANAADYASILVKKQGVISSRANSFAQLQ